MNKFTISRTFDAPRGLVFKCWVEPEHFEKWGLSPAGCTCRILHADVRPGGYYLQQEVSPDGSVLFIKQEFRQISPIDKLVFVISFATQTGEPATHPYLPEWPDHLLTTVTFEDEEAGTKVTVLWEPIEASAEQLAFFMENLHLGQQGWSETFDRLQSTIDELSLSRLE